MAGPQNCSLITHSASGLTWSKLYYLPAAGRQIPKIMHIEGGVHFNQIFHPMPDLDFLYSTTNFFTWNFQYLPCLDFLFKPTDFPHEFFTLCPIWTFYTRLTFFHVNFSINASFGLSIQYYHLFTWIFSFCHFWTF